MTPRFPRRAALAGLPFLFVVHNDFWLWSDQSLVLGLPVGLVYHIGYCVVAALMMLLLVRHAWPEHLEIEDEAGDNSANTSRKTR